VHGERAVELGGLRVGDAGRVVARQRREKPQRGAQLKRVEADDAEHARVLEARVDLVGAVVQLLRVTSPMSNQWRGSPAVLSRDARAAMRMLSRSSATNLSAACCKRN
jgi:hypothetical protein